jgi:hypothetical protein
MANFMRKVQNTPKMKANKRKRRKLEVLLSKAGREYQRILKSESRRLAKKTKATTRKRTVKRKKPRVRRRRR